MSNTAEIVSRHATALDRSKAPKPGPLPLVAFPHFSVTTLSNGLQVFIVENHEQPLVSVSLSIRAGSSLDTAELAGLASICGDMLIKGTSRRTANQIAEEIDFVGGQLYSSASWDSLSISTGVLTKYLPVALDLLADVTLHSSFPAEELDRARLQRIAGLRQAKADAGFLADMIFSQLVFEGHPYGVQANGTPESIERIKREDLARFYSMNAGPNNAFVVAAGDVDPAWLCDELERSFAGWKAVEKSPATPPVDVPLVPRVALMEKKGAVQSALRVGHIGIARNDPDFTAVSVLNMLLGGYFNSRINLNLRERNGYTYGARSGFDARIQRGPFSVSTEVRTEVTIRAIEEIVSELTRITVEPVSDEEIEMVKNYMMVSSPLQIETPQQVANRVSTIATFGLPYNYFDTYRTVIATITKEELMRVAQKFVHPGTLSIIASGDTTALKSAMTEFGNVTVYDADSNILEVVQKI